jgi:hypothetical protein
MAYCLFTNCLSIIGSGITPYTSLDSRSGVSLTSNGQMAFFGSSDNSGPLGMVFQHINANGICRSDITSTRYGVSGNDLSLNVDSTNPYCTGGMLIKYGGGVAISTGQPCGALDVFKQGAGSTGTGDILIVRGGNNGSLFGTNQIRFGYAGSIGYSHAIKTRHQSASPYQNTLDFFLWTPSDAIEAVGTKNVMTLDGSGRMGINNCAPQFPLHVDSSGVDTVAFMGASGMTSNQSIYFELGKNCTSINNAGEVSFKYVGDNNSTNMVSLGFYGNGQKLNVLASGNVGIGQTSPSGYGHGGTNRILEISNSNASANSQAHVILSSGATSCNGSLGSVTWAGTNYSSANRAGIISVATETTATNIPQSYMQFYVSDSVGGILEKMRITSCGNLGVGTTSPTYKLQVNGTFYAAGSSQDYKQGICQYDTDSCMFMKLKPVTYQYKEEYKHLGKELKSKTQIGLIAEEVAETYPELAILVKENDNDVVRNVDYEKLSIVLLAEVQKLRKEVDDLKTK